MIRTVVAGLVFLLLYGIAMRLYLYLRAHRDAHRWHGPAIAWAGVIGGVAFYLAQQVRDPYVPGALDIPAFFILALAAAVLPFILDLTVVLRARLLQDSALQGPHHVKVPQDKS